MRTPEQPADGQKTLIGAISRWWRNWTTRRAAVDELTCCSREDLAEIARDLGINSSDLRTLAGRWPDSTELLRRRLSANGLDEAQLALAEPEVLRDLQRVCSFCADGRSCRRDLDRDAGDPRWRSYCPNATTLDALQAERETERLIGRKRRWRAF